PGPRQPSRTGIAEDAQQRPDALAVDLGTVPGDVIDESEPRVHRPSLSCTASQSVLLRFQQLGDSEGTFNPGRRRLSVRAQMSMHNRVHELSSGRTAAYRSPGCQFRASGSQAGSAETA